MQPSPILTNEKEKKLVDNKLKQLFDLINANSVFKVKSWLEMNIGDKVSCISFLSVVLYKL